jgi:peptidoglycan hydrolase-like protein with peptidoglycan-binding domain
MKRASSAGIAVALVAAGVGGYLYRSGRSDDDSAAQPTGNRPAATAVVTRQTLMDTESHDGSLAYADTTTIKTKLSGTLTAMAAAGSTVKRSQSPFKIDNKPVVLLYGSLPAYRMLSSGMKGNDVEQLEQNLWALGYRGFTVDKEYTSATTSAVREWQEDLGLTRTGTVELGRVVFATGAVRVDSLSAALDDALRPGAPVLRVSSLGRVATVELEIGDQRLAKKGAAVDVTLPDGTEVDGRISQVQTRVETAVGDDGQDTTKIDVTIGFSRTPPGLDEAAVRVDFVASRAEDVLTVPVKALLALSEGGYGLQVVEGDTTTTRTVRTGLFADGRVEVSGNGLTEGMKVGVPG